MQSPNHLTLDGDPVPPRPLSFHRRIARMWVVKYVLSVIGNLVSMTIMLVIAFLLGLNYGGIPSGHVQARLLEATNTALAFVLPDYFSEVGDLAWDFDSTQKGWIVISDIGLIDPANLRTVEISEFRMSPSIRGLLSGSFAFHFVGAENVQINYQTAPSVNSKQIALPLNILDIPTQLLKEGGSIELDDVQVNVLQPSGVQLLSVKNLRTSLVKSADGYDARLSALHADDNTAAFSLRVQKKANLLSIKGNARRYPVSAGSEAIVDMDLDLGFEGVPEFDLTNLDNDIRLNEYLKTGNGRLVANFAGWDLGGRFDFDPDKNQINLAQMRGTNEKYDLVGDLQIDLSDQLLLRGQNISVSYPAQNDSVDIEGAHFVGKLDLATRQLDIGEFSVKNDDLHIWGQSEVNFGEDLHATIGLNSSKLNRSSVVELWPEGLAPKVQSWLQDRLHAAEMEDLRLDVSIGDRVAVEMASNVRNVELEAVRFLPVAKAEQVYVRITNDTLFAKTKHAQMEADNGEVADISDIEFTIEDFKQRPLQAKLEAGVEGQVGDLMVLLTPDPIKLPERIKLAADKFSGEYEGKLSLGIPLKSGLKFNELDLDVTADISNFTLSNIYKTNDVKVAVAKLELTQNEVSIDGVANYGGLTAPATLLQKFAKGSKIDLRTKGTASLAQLAGIGVKLPSFFKGDRVGFDIGLLPKSDGLDINGTADISRLAINLPVVGGVKSAGQSGNVEFGVEISAGNVLVDIKNAKGGSIIAQGDIGIKGGKMSNLDFPKVTIADKYSGGFSTNGDQIRLYNGRADFQKLGLGGAGGAGNGSSNATNVQLENVDLQLTPTIALRSMNGTIKTGNGVTGDFTARINGGAAVAGKIEPYKGRIKATVRANDAGGVLRNAGLFSDLSGGDLTLKVATTDRAGVLAGSVFVQNSRLLQNRNAVQLLQAASLIGMFDTGGIDFSEISGDFILNSSQIDLYSTHAFGPSLGITIGGSYQMSNKNAGLVGVITPAYLLNGVWQQIPGLGKVLGGNRGEGVFGVTYSINGQAPNYNISANPLSLLTPGFLREIWGPVPQINSIPEKYRVE